VSQAVCVAGRIASRPVGPRERVGAARAVRLGAAQARGPSATAREQRHDMRAGRAACELRFLSPSSFVVLSNEVLQYILMKFLVLIVLRVDLIPMKSFCEQAVESSVVW
jgi:hypothetical protein